MQQVAMKWLVVATVMIGWNTSDWAKDPDAGKIEFLSSCATCHGTDGKGHGPLSAELKTAPADLTTIAKRNNGVFPVSVVYETVDGRKGIKSHGTRDMPIWGYRYTLPPTPAATDYSISEALIRARILALVDYLSRIQEK